MCVSIFNASDLQKHLNTILLYYNYNPANFGLLFNNLANNISDYFITIFQTKKNRETVVQNIVFQISDSPKHLRFYKYEIKSILRVHPCSVAPS